MTLFTRPKFPKLPELMAQLKENRVSEDLQYYYFFATISTYVFVPLLVPALVLLGKIKLAMQLKWAIMVLYAWLIIITRMGMNAAFKANQHVDGKYYVNRLVCLLGHLALRPLGGLVVVVGFLLLYGMNKNETVLNVMGHEGIAFAAVFFVLGMCAWAFWWATRQIKLLARSLA